MLAEPAESLELSLTAVTELGAVVEGLFMRRTCKMLVQLGKRAEPPVTEVAFIGAPIPGLLSCPGLGWAGDQSVRVRYKVGPISFGNETVQALACKARFASSTFKM